MKKKELPAYPQTIYIDKRNGSKAEIMIAGEVNFRQWFRRCAGVVVRIEGGAPEIVRKDWFIECFDRQQLNPDVGEWSPLESAEKRVIENQLFLNKWNKNRTRKELGITINTLNAKIIKHGMVKPL